MVEDPQPPAYEPVALNDDADGPALPTEPKAITSSLRDTNRLLFSVGGWRASFRGILCASALLTATMLVGGIFGIIPFVPSFIGTLLASLALVQLHTTWVHIIISNPSPLPFWKRLPPFRKTLEATWVPVIAHWFSVTLLGWVPGALVYALGLPIWDPKEKNKVPHFEPSMAWKGGIIALVFLAVTVFLVVPAQVILVRVQASLLPPGEDPIIPFDRSFDGTVEPAIVGGKGYVTWRNALKTFPRSSWVRLYVLYLKAFLVTWGVYFLWAVVVIPEMMLLSKDGAPSEL